MEMDFANAFKEMSLCEDVFPLGTEKDKEELKTFIDSDELGLNTIIDGEAETVDDIKDSYVGQVVLRCPVCQSMVYRAKENIVVDEDSDLVNIGDECPYCLTTDGYEIVGEIKEYCPECDGKEKEEVKVKTVSVEESKKRARIRKALKENVVNSEDIFDDLLDRAKSYVKEGSSSERAVENAIDDGLIYTSDIVSLYDEYVGLNGGELLASFYDNLYSDLLGALDETDLDESKKGIVTKKAKRVVEEKETVDFTKKTQQGYDVVRLYKDGYRTHAIVKRMFLGKPDYVVALGYNTSDGTWAQGRYSWDNIADARKALFDEKGFLSAIIESTCKRPNGRTKGVKTEAKSTKRDIIDAEADNKKEIVRKYIARKVDDADADRDYRLKKGVTRAFESLERIEDIRGQILDFGDKYFTLDYRDGKLIAGGATNTGVIPKYTVKYDSDESIYSNLEKLYDIITADIDVVEESKKPMKRKAVEKPKTRPTKKVTESVEEVEVKTETDKIEVRPTEDGVEVKTEKREETIEPVSDETKVEILGKDELGKDEADEFTDIDIDEFDEASFDEVEEESLKRFYENVDSYKTTSGRIKGNKLIVEGVIKFKSGKTKPTKFVFESHSATKNGGKLKFYGLNEQYAKAKKSIAINGRIDGKSLVVEGLTHNFNTNGQRIYKTVKRNIKK